MWAKKGAKVVCIDNGERMSPSGRCCEPEIKPEIGGVYTIRKITLYDDDVCVFLTELRQLYLVKRFGLFTARVETPYLVGRFAPVVATKNAAGVSQADDISTHFQSLLTAPVTTEEPA